MHNINLRQNEKKNKSLKMTFICCSILVLTAFLFSVTADLPHVLFITLLLSAASMLIRKPFKYSDRMIIYSIVFSGILAVIPDLIFPMDEQRFFLLDYYFKTNITAPFLIYFGAFITMFASNSYVPAFTVCFSLGVSMLSGDLMNVELVNERFVFTDFLLENIDNFYLTMLCVQSVFYLMAFSTAIPENTKKPPANKKNLKISLLFLALASLVGFSIASAYLFKIAETQIHELDKLLVNSYSRFFSSSDKILFSDKINLHRTISNIVRNNQKMVVFRSVGSNPPGYLRGRAYSSYKNGIWFVPNTNKKIELREIDPEGILSYSTFYIKDDISSSKPGYTIFPSEKYTGQRFFIPGNSAALYAVSEGLDSDIDGNVQGIKWKSDGGYTVLSNELNQYSAYQQPVVDKENSEKYTKIQKELKPFLKSILTRQIKLDKKKREKLSDRQISTMIMNYFRKNFEYTLEPPEEAMIREPLLNFMLSRKKGHCELFAASMVLLLRENNIPARYVTGFICEEQHPSGKYYIARLGNAHAWCEAYLKDEKKWILLDPTPPSELPDFGSEWSQWEIGFDHFKQMLQEAFSQVRRGFFAKAIINFLKAFFQILIYIILNPYGIAFIFFSLILIIFLVHRKVRISNRRIFRYLDSKKIVKLKKEFMHFEKFVSRKFGIKRKSDITINEWSQKILKKMHNSDFSVEIPDLFYKIITLYQKMRFSAEFSLENKKIMTEKIKKFRSIIKNIKK